MADQPIDLDEARIQQLLSLLKRELDLQKEYEDQQLYEDDPRKIAKIDKDLAKLVKDIAAHRAEYNQILERRANAQHGAGQLAFSEGLLQGLPYPLAVKCAAFNAAAEVTARFQALDGLLRNTVKTLAAVALAQYRHDQNHSDKLLGWLKRISRHHLDEWAALLREIDGYYHGSPNPPALLALLFEPYHLALGTGSPLGLAYQEIAAQLQLAPLAQPATQGDFLDQLARLRAYTWEAGSEHLTAAWVEHLVMWLQPALAELLQGYTLLHSRPIAYARAAQWQAGAWVYEMEKWCGANAQPQPVPSAPLAGSEAQPPLKTRRLYLCDPQNRPLLNLHPLFIHHAKSEQLYFLEFLGEAQDLSFRACHGGQVLENPEELKTSLKGIVDPQGQVDICDQFDQVDHGVDSMNIDPFGDLLARLNPDSRTALETGLGEALRLGHFWVGLEFLLMALTRAENNGLWELLQTLQLDPADLRGALRGLVRPRKRDWRIQKNMQAAGAAVLPGARRATFSILAEADPAELAAHPVISPRLHSILTQAARLSGERLVTPNHLLLAAMAHGHCPPINLLIGQMLESGYDPQEFVKHLIFLSETKPEDAQPPKDEPPAPVVPPLPAPGRPGARRGLLDQFGRDLTALAQAGKLGPALGEHAHKAMTQIGRILLQTGSNNPILLGDPGVGKTAIVEGFAYRLARDPNLTARLAGLRIIDLPVTALLAGTSYRGQLEERLQQLIKEVQAAQGQVIVFIDEIHTILGGKSEGGLGAIADALKPALARGEFPCIGATTVAEYRRYIEADPALARRFSPVWIEEPSIEDAIQIARGVAAARLAPHHQVLFPDEAIAEAVHLAARYIPDEFLPGKAIKLLDEAGPHVLLRGTLQGGAPLDENQPVGGEVTVEILRQIIAERTGIPLAQLSQSDQQRLRDLKVTLQARVRGQDEAIAAVVRVVKRARAGLADPRRPLGVFLFAGPTGVGKTELARALAAALFDDEKAFLNLNMPEFAEKHQLARLVGSPPGYVGYEEEGQLTGYLRRRPYCVVLLDEMEKAHKDVQHFFLQLFDAGRISDARSRLVNGCNAIFIMTTNLNETDIQRHFTAEFRNRLDDTIHFHPLTPDLLVAIFDKFFAGHEQRLTERGVQVELSAEFKVRFCAAYAGADMDMGARPLDHAIKVHIVDRVADELLEGEITQATELEPGFVIRPLPKSKAKSSPAPAKAPGAAKPTPARPAKPLAAALPADKAHNQQRLHDLLDALNAELSEQHITLELDESAWELLGDPKWSKQLPDSSVEQAFERLVRQALLDALKAGQFQASDRLRARRNIAAAGFFISFDKI